MRPVAATYSTTSTPRIIADRLLNARRILITSHDKPDGDAIGSVLALARALRQRGRTVDTWFSGPFDPTLQCLLGHEKPGRAPEKLPGDDYDAIAVLDTGSWGQLEHLGPWLRERRDRAVGVDHHRCGDTDFADRIVDTSCASCTQVLIPVIEALGVKFDQPGMGGAESVAEALFAGLATDTGWFRFSNADSGVFTLAARLINAGVEKDRLYRQLEENSRPQRLSLMGRALSNMRWLANNRAAIMQLHPEDFATSSGSSEDLAGVVNAPMQVGTTECSILISQTEPGVVKISFRSKPALHAGGPYVDVNRLAGEFGGGGHIHAAGARVRGELPQVAEQVAKAVERAIQNLN
ncbi:MAG: DHH family phosphoesterase [Planctomycetes bacterium]|nr:DHH family phosphoesterase [Planctomycetota bacterium]